MLLSRKLLCELSPNFSKVSDDHIRTGVMNMGMEVEQIIQIMNPYLILQLKKMKK